MWGWLVTLIVGLFQGFGAAAAKKSVMVGAVLATSTTLFVALNALIMALFAGISATLPDWASAGAIFLPDNLSICLSALITAKFGRAVYDWNIKNLHMASGANMSY
jgi:hypothetical protein